MSLVISPPPHISSDGKEEFKERSSVKRLSVSELSRILEVPLSLLETEQQPNEANDDNEQQPRYWMPTCNSISPQFQDVITHSFANRKRSVVKRRKSVLSHSFTAESEAEAIRMEREAALAALENRLKKEEQQQQQRRTSSIMNDKRHLRRSASLTLLPTNTEFGYPDIQNSPILIFGRGPALRRGAKSKFQRRSSCDTPSEIPSYLSNTVENQELPASTTSIPSSPPIPSLTLTPSTCFTLQVSDYSSDTVTSQQVSSSSAMHHQQCLLPEESQEVEDQLFAIESNPKKIKLPWSKRIFSKTKKQKSSSVMILNNNNEDNEKMDDSIDQVRPNQSKFNLSSLFFRKQNLNALKKNKSAVNLSTPAKDASPFTTDTLMSYYNTKTTNNFNNNRLPIHKERAIYKLSHLKLTHPRRPLRDQVMISNLMFWYLSIINQSSNHASRKAFGIPIAGINRRGTGRRRQIRHYRPSSPKPRHTTLGSDDDSSSSSDEEEFEKVYRTNNRQDSSEEEDDVPLAMYKSHLIK